MFVVGRICIFSNGEPYVGPKRVFLKANNIFIHSRAHKTFSLSERLLCTRMGRYGEVWWVQRLCTAD